MQAPNRKKVAPKARASREERIEKRHKGIMTMFHMIASAFSLGNTDDKDRAERKAAHMAFIGGGQPMYIPRKHTIMNYATQRRNAKARRRAR